MKNRSLASAAALLLGGVVGVSCGGGDGSDVAGAFPPDEVVDLLVLTDSSGSGLADRYALLAADALDREVRVHDWAVPGAPITDVLDRLEPLGDLVAKAEIIVVYGMPAGLEQDLPKPDILSCLEAEAAVAAPDEYDGDWTPGTPWGAPVATTEDWHLYREVLDEVYDRIWTLRDGRPTILRTYDVPIGFLAPWRELGIESECLANWEVQAQVVREAAEAHGAGFVSVIDVFNGPDHDEDPVQKGWISADDLWHASEEGKDVIAETLAAYGFDLSEPPG